MSLAYLGEYLHFDLKITKPDGLESDNWQSVHCCNVCLLSIVTSLTSLLVANRSKEHKLQLSGLLSFRIRTSNLEANPLYQ